MDKSASAKVASQLTLARVIALLVLLYIFLTEALIRANIISMSMSMSTSMSGAPGEGEGSDMNVHSMDSISSTPLLHVPVDGSGSGSGSGSEKDPKQEIKMEMGWDEGIASQVPLFAPNVDAASYKKQKSKQKPPTRTRTESTANDNTITSASAYLVYDSSSSAKRIKLQNPITHYVLDQIHVDDIIGAEIEFCLGSGSDPSSETCTVDSKYEKAAKGREMMESLERDIGQQLLSGSGNGNGKSEGTTSPTDGMGMGMGMGGATAYLNIYAYPKALRRKGILGQIKDCLHTKNHNHQADEHENENETEPIDDPNLFGHRQEHHRRYKLQPMEDFTNARKLVQNIRHVAQLNQHQHQRYLVVVNPFSGTKKGKHIYETIVKKMLDESGIQHDVLWTEYAGHASERMMMKKNSNNDEDGTDTGTGTDTGNQRDVSEYHGVIAMGGDGILAEILKGLKSRSDCDAIMDRIKFGIVGCGTSNGLAKTLLHAAKEKYSPLESTFLICKGRSSKLDLSHYETENETHTSFLTFAWGFVADSDIESECIRFMGELRNDIWAVWRILNLRTYRGKFSYLPAENVKGASKSANQIASADQIVDNFPEWKDDVPSNWVTIEDDFILFWASQVTHASMSLMNSPGSQLNDGVFDVFVIRQPCSKLELIKILLSAEHGTHIKYPKAEFFRCVAFRLDPISSGSFNDIDGEVVQPGRIQARVEPGKLKFFA